MTKDNQEKTWKNGGKKLKETEVTARNGANGKKWVKTRRIRNKQKKQERMNKKEQMERKGKKENNVKK